MDNGASSYRRFLDGDKNAFGEIVDELMYGLIYFINSYVHDFHTAEDIAMDVMADLIANRHRYNFKVKLKTYLYMVARSRALDLRCLLISHSLKKPFSQVREGVCLAGLCHSFRRI